MSIEDEINALGRAGVLHELEPVFASPKRRRKVWLSSPVNSMIDGPWDTRKEEFRWGYVRADLEALIQGPLITVATDPRRARDAQMSQLLPPSDEVWDVRCRDPRPGIRILGRFALKDVFIGLTWEPRLFLKDFDSPEWTNAIAKCQQEWNRRFWNQPLMGNYPDDYLSGTFFERYS